MPRFRSDDISLLLPTMRLRVQSLLDAMTALGYQPILFDGLRTAEEAVANAKKGTGVVASMHLYGCAADLICDQHGWQCRAKKCKFYQNLKREAVKLGFVCGADFGSVDEPHVQAVFVGDQGPMRNAKTETARELLVQKFFALRDAALAIKAESYGTPETIRAFQRAAGLTVDGNAGPRTQAALKRALRPF